MTDAYKSPPKLAMRLSAEEQRILGRLLEEQHAKLRAAGALLAAPTVPDIVRSLIAREGERLDGASGPGVIETLRGPVGAAGGTSVARDAILNGPASELWAESGATSDPASAQLQCRDADDHGEWPVSVPTDGDELAIVSIETRTIFKRANLERNAMIVAYYYHALTNGERFPHPITFPYTRGIQP